jgi:trigger factor
MQVSVEKGEGLEHRMTVELPAEEINKEVEKRLKDIARKARMDGFRPGKVPLKVLRTRYGLHLQQEVFGEMIQSSLSRAVADAKLRPAGPPRVEPVLDQAQDAARFAYTAVFEVLPEIELAPLSGYTVQTLVASVEEADMDEMIERLRKQRQTWNEVQRPARDGDRLIVSFVGKVDGEAFVGGSADDRPLVLGSGAMIGGFEAGLVGASAGESRVLDLTFPDDYRVEALAGKPATFEVEIKSVSEAVVPEVDAEFAKSFGVDDGDLERFRADIRKNMERELSQRVRAATKSQVMDVLLEAHPLDLPQALVDEEVETLRKQTRQNMGGSAGNRDLPASLFDEQARRRVALGLIIAEVVKGNGLKVDPQRVQSTIEDIAASYEDPREVVSVYSSNREQRSALEGVVLEEQVVDWVLSQVQVVEEQSSFKAVTEGHG